MKSRLMDMFVGFGMGWGTAFTVILAHDNPRAIGGILFMLVVLSALMYLAAYRLGVIKK